MTLHRCRDAVADLTSEPCASLARSAPRSAPRPYRHDHACRGLRNRLGHGSSARELRGCRRFVTQSHVQLMADVYLNSRRTLAVTAWRSKLNSSDRIVAAYVVLSRHDQRCRSNTRHARRRSNSHRHASPRARHRRVVFTACVSDRGAQCTARRRRNRELDVAARHGAYQIGRSLGCVFTVEDADDYRWPAIDEHARR